MIARLISNGLIAIGFIGVGFGIYGWWTEPPWPPPRAGFVEPQREVAGVVAGEETVIGFEFRNPTAKKTLIGGINRC